MSASDARGVGSKRLASTTSRFGFLSPLRASVTAPVILARGVGNDPNPVPFVRGADGFRWYAIPLSVKPALGQVPENDAHPISKQRCHVLHNCVLRSYHAKGSHQFPVES